MDTFLWMTCMAPLMKTLAEITNNGTIRNKANTPYGNNSNDAKVLKGQELVQIEAECSGLTTVWTVSIDTLHISSLLVPLLNWPGGKLEAGLRQMKVPWRTAVLVARASSDGASETWLSGCFDLASFWLVGWLVVSAERHKLGVPQSHWLATLSLSVASISVLFIAVLSRVIMPSPALPQRSAGSRQRLLRKILQGEKR